MNSLILAAHLLNPAASASDTRQQLIDAAAKMNLQNTTVKVCVDDVCDSFMHLGTLPLVGSRTMAVSGNGEGEGEERPIKFAPHAPLPMTRPNVERGGGSETIQMIMTQLKSMTAIEGGIEVEYKHKNPKTGEETELKIKVNGSFGKADGK